MNAAVSETTNLPVKRVSLVQRVAAKYEIDADKMLETMKVTCFKQKGNSPAVTNEQMMALLIVAEQYNLNPFTKEIYAFPSDGGITPIIGFDGWIRMINEHPQMQDMELAYAPEGSENPWIECTIWRRDRGKPVTIREYLDECIRDTGPWKSHPRRMLRHKAIIQCARVAFGFGGVYDPDEGDRIANAINITPDPSVVSTMKPKTEAPKARSKFRDEVHPEPESAKACAAQSATEAAAIDAVADGMGGVVGMSVDQVTVIRDKLKESKVEENALLAKFEVGDVQQIAGTRYKLVLNWIAAAAVA